MIQGASGGVGPAAVAMASARGAEVIAVLPRAGKECYVRELGASAVVRLYKGELVEAMRPGTVGAVLETLGTRTFADSVTVLRRGGRLCLVGALTGEVLTMSAWDLLLPCGRRVRHYAVLVIIAAVRTNNGQHTCDPLTTSSRWTSSTIRSCALLP